MKDSLLYSLILTVFIAIQFTSDANEIEGNSADRLRK